MTALVTNNKITVFIDGTDYQISQGISVAAALAATGTAMTRISVTGMPRTAFCGMGVCQECRVTVNGVRVLACQTQCQQNMYIERSAGEGDGSTM